ncbi:MAG: hypothetical protein ACHQD7_13700 [Chitinophagales bacterium]
MKKIFSVLPWVAFLTLPLFFISCKKDKASTAKSEKYQIVEGVWKQIDIVLGVPVSIPAGGNTYDFPAGTSVITDPYLNAFGVSALFSPTQDNVYTFSDNGTYTIQGVTDLILPVAGNTGTWNLDVYDAVLKLVSANSTNDPHWINGISSDSLSLSMIVEIPGLGTAPLNLILRKQ